MGRNFFNASASESAEAATAEGAAQASDTADGAQVEGAQVDAAQDASHGLGGLYELRGGQRVLIERTAQEGSDA